MLNLKFHINLVSWVFIKMAKKLLIFVLLFFLTSFSISDFFSRKTYVYVSTVNSKKIKTTWTIKKNKDDAIVIDKTNDEELSTLTYSPKYFLQEEKVKSVSLRDDYTFSLNKNRLKAFGKLKGRKLSRTHNIRYPWIQDFKFGFLNFLKSKYSEYKFVILNPEDFSINNMIATKKEITQLKINGIKYNTQKIIVTLQGFKSMFWKGEIWFDLETLSLVKYKANNGPGTPVMTTVLDSKKDL